ncbi:hypothetical protein PM082_011972 [Marasmius tenuissimus]|nr:hypothetical protein PM082_011972 [Marasmius tenuissimus]
MDCGRRAKWYSSSPSDDSPSFATLRQSLRQKGQHRPRNRLSLTAVTDASNPDYKEQAMLLLPTEDASLRNQVNIFELKPFLHVPSFAEYC